MHARLSRQVLLTRRQCFSRRVFALGAASVLLLAVASAFTADRPIILHPKCKPLPFDFLGPFVKLGDGSVLAMDDVKVHVSRDDGQTWTARPLFKDAANFTANDERAVLRTKSGVVVYAFSNAKETVFKWDRKNNQPLPGIRRPLYVVRSLDDGRTWEEPRLVQDSYCGATRHMIQLRSGRIILGSQEAVSNPGRHVTFTFASDDDGATWKQSNVIDLGKSGGYGDHGGGIEATLTQLHDGRLWMLMRNPQPHFREAFSTDEGLTWTDVRHSEIEASPAPGLLWRLQSGRLALFWNRWIDREKKLGRREQLSFALSEDDGRTWTPPVIVAKDPTAPGDTGPEHRVSYPYVYEHKPGELWVTTMQGQLRMKLREVDFLPASGSEKLAEPAAAFKLTLQKRVEAGGKFKVVRQTGTWPAKQTAVIVCDMWDLHHCKNAVLRVKEMAPRMNAVLEKARDRGALIIHAPSSCMKPYEGTPARLRAQAAPTAANLPAGIGAWCKQIPAEEKGTYPIDQSDGGEDDDPAEHQQWAAELKARGLNPRAPWTRQVDVLKIRDEDAVSDSGVEIWNLLEQRGIRNVILLGVHVNMCVAGRPFGLRQLAKNGKHVVLMSDMTDSMYNPAKWPYVDHFQGTALFIEHVEKYICPTVTSDQILGGRPFVFSGQSKKR